MPNTEELAGGVKAGASTFRMGDTKDETVVQDVGTLVVTVLAGEEVVATMEETTALDVGAVVMDSEEGDTMASVVAGITTEAVDGDIDGVRDSPVIGGANDVSNAGILVGGVETSSQEAVVSRPLLLFPIPSDSQEVHLQSLG